MKVILLGASGRIGAATLNALTTHQEISSVVGLTRKPLLTEHSKSKNVVHDDFATWPDSLLTSELAGAAACIWTMGIRPSLVKSHEQAHSIEVDAPLAAMKAFTESLAPTLANETKFRFLYVSGMASETDPKRSLWFANDARKLKGETEVGIEQMNKDAADNFEGHVAKSGHVVGDAGGIAAGIAGMIPSMAIKESELAMAMIDIALHGGDRRVWTNGQLVERGRAAIKRTVRP